MSYGQHCASTGKMHLFSRADEENELVVFDRSGKPTLTPFYHQVWEAALDHHARLAVLDVSVDLFGGDEINRRNVRAFMRPLNVLARQIDGAVVLTSHLSQAGIRSEGGRSGSTDWSNASRSRAYLSRPKPEDSEPTEPTRASSPAKKQTSPASATLSSCTGRMACSSRTDFRRRTISAAQSKTFSSHCSTNIAPQTERSPGIIAPATMRRELFARLPARSRDDYREADLKGQWTSSSRTERSRMSTMAGRATIGKKSCAKPTRRRKSVRSKPVFAVDVATDMRRIPPR